MSAIGHGAPNDEPAPVDGAHNIEDASRHVHSPTLGEGDTVVGDHTRQQPASVPFTNVAQSPAQRVPRSTDAESASELTQAASKDSKQAVNLESRLTIRNAEKWHEALKTLKDKHEHEYDYIDLVLRETQGLHSTAIDRTLPEYIQQDPKSNDIVRRAKRWLPTMASVRSVVMPIAALDPYKIAPIICAGFFAIAEIATNGPNAEYRSKALDAYFAVGNAINNGLSFEAMSAMGPEEQELKNQLPDIYIMALRLMCSVQLALDKLSDKSKWSQMKQKAVALMKNDPDAWAEQVKDLKQRGENLSGARKRINEREAAESKVAAALRWMRSSTDPEATPSNIEREITSDGRSKNYAQWFLDSNEYEAWHRILLSLQAFESTQGPNEPVRVIPYFCSAQGALRSGLETIIRSLTWKLSWRLDSTLAPSAYDFHDKKTTGPEMPVPIEEWQALFARLIGDCDKLTRIAILVDGLDALDETEGSDLFLDYMKSIIEKHGNVFLVFSSHQHVLVDNRFAPPDLVEFKVTPEDTMKDLEAFVDTEINYGAADSGAMPVNGRNQDNLAKTRRVSIFFRPGQEQRRKDMRNLLLTGARGMFVWVKIWLQILFPRNHPQKLVLTEEHAEKLLDQLRGSGSQEQAEQLQTAYQRLWTLSEYDSYQKTRLNLFRFVLCWAERLSVARLTRILRLKLYEEGPDNASLSQQDVRDLGADFLTFDHKDKINFAHDSARAFVSQKINEGGDLSVLNRKSHCRVLKLFSIVLSSPDSSDRFVAYLAIYFFEFLAHHCERSIEDALSYDKEWERLFDQVLLLHPQV
ncbi:hypothetical protein J4E90_010546 [Alternaria incomplexa]|uniref:uncharacterized protein n=1 Tax=Alternaria incomplexa TaxID=1187928 RepID=UPI0022211E91|nr:uncharacterized protein J4E90_010546 [Alternaria incomplexa]KAI4906472.1 hypothetical protein J4E90_010546 [Alternaria incomplexa]